MLFGAHNSIAGAFTNAVDEAVGIGGECMQIFCKNHRQFRARPIEDEEAQAFRDAVRKAELGPVMVHDSYIINLGQSDPEKLDVAQKAFAMEWARCEQLGVDYLNFHPGSHAHPDKSLRDDPATRNACLDRIAEGVVWARSQVPGKVRPVIENAAGQGSNVGSTWEEVAYLADALSEQGVEAGVCVDTQHAWAAGYDWGDYDAVWDSFDDTVGRKRLVALHLNDSKQPRGSRLDRHDNIGQGQLGKAFWATLATDPRLQDVPGYLETPRPTIDTWREELDYLKSLRG